MGSFKSKKSWTSPFRTLPKCMYENHGLRTHVCLNKWVNLTRKNLELQWPQWRTFSLDELADEMAQRKKSHTSPKQQDAFLIGVQRLLRLN